MKNNCPLCKNNSAIFYQFKKRLYHQCNNCKGVFVDPALILPPEEEKLRYEEHNNDVNDKRFQKFVSPITDLVQKEFTENHFGLDFGAGFAPVITKVLTDRNYNIKPYDPFFFNDSELLRKKYDYITSCEVVEHFHNPAKEFKLLRSLLNPGGKVFIKTWLVNDETDFHNWNYKDDHTHVFIFHENSLQWIKENIGFSYFKIDERIITFTK